MRDDNPVLFAYDETPEPHLYIGVRTIEGLRQFIDLFEGLVEGNSNHVELADLGFLRLQNLDSVILSSVDPSIDSEDVTVKRDGKTTCFWKCSPANWKLGLDMLRVLERRGGAAHQFLPPDRKEDLEIEFDYTGPAA